MKKINNNLFINGNLYTDMYMDIRLLSDSPNSITIHVKEDVFFGVLKKPNSMKSGDLYIRYEDFIKQYGEIYDVIAFSKIYAG